MPRSAKLSGIKSLPSYTVQEAAEVTGVSERTIRSWIKAGLPAMKQERPTLLRGDALIAFIKAQRKARKTKIRQDEFYCLKCRAPRHSAGKLVQCETDGVRAKLIAICEICDGLMHKPVALGDIPKLAKVFELIIADTRETPQNHPAE